MSIVRLDLFCVRSFFVIALVATNVSLSAMEEKEQKIITTKTQIKIEKKDTDELALFEEIRMQIVDLMVRIDCLPSDDYCHYCDCCNIIQFSWFNRNYKSDEKIVKEISDIFKKINNLKQDHFKKIVGCLLSDKMLEGLKKKCNSEDYCHGKRCDAIDDLIKKISKLDKIRELVYSA